MSRYDRKNVVKLENNCHYENCTFNLDEQPQTVRSSTFVNCSFRTLNLDFEVIESCKFTQCNFNNVVINKLYDSIFTEGYIAHLRTICVKDVSQLNFLDETVKIKSLHLDRYDLSERWTIQGKLTNKIGSFTSLEHLNLYDHEIETLPAEIGQLTELKTLNLSKNKLSMLPVEIGNLTKLKDINLSENQLVSLPEAFGNLVNLSTINLNHNCIELLPQMMNSLTHVQIFEGQNNHFQVFPGFLEYNLGLKNLNLKENHISIVPEWLGELSALIELHIRDNNLTCLTNEICKLQQLEQLVVDKNPLSYIPTEVLDYVDSKKFTMFYYKGELDTPLIRYLEDIEPVEEYSLPGFGES